MENISDINTVQDLLNANEEESPTEAILKAIYEEEPEVGLSIVKSVLASLAKFHVEVTNNLVDEKDESVVGWAKDATLLETASKIVNEVEL